jgi:hypothetical protein
MPGVNWAFVGRCRKPAGCSPLSRVVPELERAGTVEAVAATSNAAFCSDIHAVQSGLDQLKFIDISLSNAAELVAAFE